MFGRFLVLAALLVACAPSSSVAPDAGPPCPGSAPSSAEVCPVAGQTCLYERCTTDGLVQAVCTADDAGAARWAVTATPCGACSSGPCTAGTVCIQRMGGALIASCGSHTCGTGPLDCDCACGEGVECTLRSGADGSIFGCRASCGADVCP